MYVQCIGVNQGCNNVGVNQVKDRRGNEQQKYFTGNYVRNKLETVTPFWQCTHTHTHTRPAWICSAYNQYAWEQIK